MKIKKAFDICKKNKVISTFYNENEEQWLSNGYAGYSIDGLPELNEDFICKLYDIKDIARDKIHFKINSCLPQTDLFLDSYPCESQAVPMDIGVSLEGLGLCIPFMTEEGVVFIQRQFLEPLLDVPKGEMLFSLRRTSAGDKYIAVKVGLLLNAIICTIKIDDNLVAQLERLYHAAAAANQNQQNQENHNVQEDTA